MKQKVIHLKRNPILCVARQTDYVFKKLRTKVILSGIHHIGQILHFDDRREFENRENEHMHTFIHAVNAPQIDEKKVK